MLNQRSTLAWLSVTLMCVGFVGQAHWHLSGERSDDAPALLESYRELAVGLPATARIGFLGATADATELSRQYFLAQSALAPRVVIHSIRDVTFVISGTRGPDQLEGFALVAETRHGIRAYVREPTR